MQSVKAAMKKINILFNLLIYNMTIDNVHNRFQQLRHGASHAKREI